MRSTVRSALAATAIGLCLAPAAAMEEKSTKPRIAVIEFKSGAQAPLQVDAVKWGEWIADVERPNSAARFKGEVAGIEPAYRSGGDSKTRGGTVDSREKITIHGGTSEARLPGKRTPPTVTLKRGQVTEAGGEQDIAVAAGAAPMQYNPKEYSISKDNRGTAASSAGGFTGGVRVATGDVDGDAAGKARYNPYVTIDYLDAPPSAGRGSLWVRVATPWAGCRVGARYPAIALGNGGKVYQLQDVVVASCSGDADDRPTEEVAFTYRNVSF